MGKLLRPVRLKLPTRPERAEAPSPGHRPGLLRMQTCRPVRAKALYIARYLKAFALTGRLADCYYTQRHDCLWRRLQRPLDA